MSQKAVREYDGKKILSKWLGEEGVKGLLCQCVSVSPETILSTLPQQPGNEWLLTTKLVVKPDQLIKRRGKAGLVGLNLNYEQVINWIEERRNKEFTIGRTVGILDTFIIEPFIPHAQNDEYYICIYSTRQTDVILFHHEGGVDIGDVNEKASKYEIDIGSNCTEIDIQTKLLQHVPIERQSIVLQFIQSLFIIFRKLHFTYLEINPLVYDINTNSLAILDLAAKIDETASFLVGKYWSQAIATPIILPTNTDSDAEQDKNNQQHCTQIVSLTQDELTFPAPFGRTMTREEAYIHDLDGKTGASLKLTILNPKGRVWMLVAGGGASVCFADAVTSVPGWEHELANYGEYSGAPSTQQTYDYTRTILDLMTRDENAIIPSNEQCNDTNSKILLIGGAIANFTDVAATFKGIIKALNQYKDKLISNNVKIYCRRGGPNYQEGLRLLRSESNKMGLNVHVYGPEVPLTSIVFMALNVERPTYTPKYVSQLQQTSGLQQGISFGSNTSTTTTTTTTTTTQNTTNVVADIEGNQTGTAVKVINMNGFTVDLEQYPSIQILDKSPINFSSTTTSTSSQSEFTPLFTPYTESIVYGLQVGAVQNMLDFDFICGRDTPSVKCLVYPFNGNHYQKFYWNTKEILIPCLTSLQDAIQKYPQVSTVVNFSSFRSVYDTSLEILQYPQIKVLAVIAEGVPEQQTRLLIQKCEKQNVCFIGPATVGGIKPGCFRIGNAGGMLDNIVASKLYRSGSVAYVSKSGGLSNELNNLIAQNTNGVYEGLAIGGDKWPGTSFITHLLRFENDPNVKIIVLLGEVGGIEELLVAELLQQGKITKPLIAWCIGTVADVFTYDVQFGHAGACAQGDMETATYKNKILKANGAIVPKSFDQLGYELNQLYSKLVENGTIPLWEEQPPRSIPVDYKWATKLGLIRKPTNFISTISDERGEELTYSGVKISDIISNPSFGGLGGTIGLLWFKKQLPLYFAKFIEIVLCLVADHGPSVAGAHVAITTARAGRDLVSCLSSGLLTIGSRFGGALDEAGRQFYNAYYIEKYTPEEFIQAMQKKKVLISGIGHKIKTIENPDSRVVEIKKFIKEHISAHYPTIKFPLLEYALKVELLTTKKKSNLILNVDGIIACVMVDLWKSHPTLWTSEEVEELLQMGVLNAFFILGRSIGLVGHVFDQSRLKQSLYRHPDDDVLYANTDLL